MPTTMPDAHDLAEDAGETLRTALALAGVSIAAVSAAIGTDVSKTPLAPGQAHALAEYVTREAARAGIVAEWFNAAGTALRRWLTASEAECRLAALLDEAQPAEESRTACSDVGANCGTVGSAWFAGRETVLH